MPSSKDQIPSTCNFQTVRLKRGSHASPEHGVCVMELASMLAGEPFSDHPRSVSPVVASFLRVYNDLVDDERRQDLYRYAAEAIGTSGFPSVERRRGRICDEWLRARKELTRRERWASQTPSAASRRNMRAEQAARWAAASPFAHAEALALVDALIAAGREPGMSGAELEPLADVILTP